LLSFIATEPQSSARDRESSTHCGKLGHEATNCFEIIGYPTGWETRSKGRACGRRDPREGRSAAGGAKGEIARTVTTTATTSSATTEAALSPIPGFTAAQV